MPNKEELQAVLPDRCRRRIVRLSMPRCVLVAGHDDPSNPPEKRQHRWSDGRDDHGNRYKYASTRANPAPSVNEQRAAYRNEQPPAQLNIEPDTACREAVEAAIRTWGTAAVVNAIAPEKVAAINTPRLAFGLFNVIARLKRERLVAVYLDAQNVPLIGADASTRAERSGVETLSQGTVNTTNTHPREILAPAIERNALGFILGHNHPSGNLTPSVADVDFTRAIKKAAETMGFDLYDHLIVSANGFVSMREKGML
jgi:hypothetical protein